VEKNRRLYPNPVAFTIRCAALARLVSQKMSCAFATTIHTAWTTISYGVCRQLVTYYRSLLT
jgi:hypothetical protein